MKTSEWTNAMDFSTSEKRGIVVLIFLCLISAAYSIVVPELISRQEIRKFESHLQGVLVNRDTITQGNVPHQTSVGGNDQQTIATGTPITGEQKTTNHVIPDRPHIAVAAQPSKLHINSASAREIIQLRRLPDKIAFRLVRFREESGGFYSVEQLKDIYGMTDSMYAGVLDITIFEAVDLQKINVNTATLEELYKHPYISKGLANQMINFREKVKAFDSSQDLLRLYFMDEMLLQKLSPYLSFY